MVLIEVVVMTKELYLTRDLAACPNCWKNFIREYNEKWDLHPENRSQGSPTQHYHDVNVELKEHWNARLNGEDWNHSNIVMFERERDYTMFILRWS